jgi:hypothetical protein
VAPERPGDFDRAHHGGDLTANPVIDDWSPEAESKIEHREWTSGRLRAELEPTERGRSSSERCTNQWAQLLKS